MEPFNLKPLPRIELGTDVIDNLPDHIKAYGSKVLLLTGNSSLERSGNGARLRALLGTASLEVSTVAVSNEPTPSLVDSIVADHADQGIEIVVALGGGSVVDAGKAVSAMLPDGEPIKDYLEGVGSKKPSGKKIPFIAIPTTAGTGSEVTSNAVISQGGEHGFKKSLRHDSYIPDRALVDPRLMCSCPPHITAACGMDTFSQLVEGYLSTKSSPITDAIAWTGIKAVSQALVTVYENPDNLDGRSHMALASLCSGIVLMNAGLGIVHGLAPPLGCLFPIPHGVVCGTLMASANDIILKKLEEEQPDSPALRKYSQLGKLFSTGKDSSDEYYRKAFIAALYALTARLNIPGLSHYGVGAADIAAISSAASSKNNPTALSDNEIRSLLEKRL
jgi:alcohol dehydrogenase